MVVMYRDMDAQICTKKLYNDFSIHNIIYIHTSSH